MPRASVVVTVKPSLTTTPSTEAKKYGDVHVVASSKDRNFSYIPDCSDASARAFRAIPSLKRRYRGCSPISGR